MFELNSLKHASDSAFDAHMLTVFKLLREGDRPQFLCSMFIPEPHRGAVAALCAFNLEIARVRQVVRDPLVGRLRLKWWYDIAEKLGSGDVPAHPIILAVDRVFSEYQLDPAILMSAVQAYVDDLSTSQPENLTELLSFFDQTLGNLNSLVIRVLSEETSEEAFQAGCHIARARGLSLVLRNLPAILSRGFICIPREICRRDSVSITDLMTLTHAGPLPEQVSKVIRIIAEIAEKELYRGRALRWALEPGVRAAFLTGLLTARELDALKVSEFDPRRLRHWSLEPGLISIFKLWWSARRGVY